MELRDFKYRISRILFYEVNDKLSLNIKYIRIISMRYLLETSSLQPHSPTLVLLIIVGMAGFIATAAIGSIAWYNSKRPQGWQDKERPGFVPKVEE